MSCVVDKADNLKVLESDSHFSDFTGMHPSKIKKGNMSFLDAIHMKDREDVIRKLRRKDSPYVYLDFNIKNKEGYYVFVHCIAQNMADSTTTHLTVADISRSAKRTENLKKRAETMNRLIDLVEAGVCLFKVHQDMRCEALYMNMACCRFFGTAKNSYLGRVHRLEELIYEEDKSKVYQAIGSAMATKKPIHMEVRILNHRPHFLWCKLNSAIQRYDEDGCPIFHAVITDISEIKAAEQAADNERDVMVNIFKNLPGPLFCADMQEPFLLDVVSKDFIHLIGYSRTEFFEEKNGDLTALIAKEDVQRAREELTEAAKEHHIIKTEYRIKTKSGKELMVIDRRRLVENVGGKRTAIGILKDPTATQVSDAINL